MDSAAVLRTGPRSALAANSRPQTKGAYPSGYALFSSACPPGLASNVRSSRSACCGLLLRTTAHKAPRPAHDLCSTPRTVVCAASSEKMTVAVTGGTGLVGSRLVAKLASQGHKVRVLTRNASAARSKLPYPGIEVFAQDQWSQGIAGCTGVVNLAGEPIATRSAIMLCQEFPKLQRAVPREVQRTRWNNSLKAELKDSRVQATTRVVDAIKKLPAEQRPKVLVSASAVGFYGNSQTTTFNEDSQGGSDYLSEVCRAWEAAAKAVEAVDGVRLVITRIGIVLARDGGALGKMLPIFQIFAGGPLGSGKQWMSWIHRDDLVDLLIEALRNPSYRGTYNATAPKPVRMAELCSALGGQLGRPSWLPVPDFALQTLLGEGASVVLEGQRVLPARTQQAGFAFKYPDVGEALKQILT